MKKVVSMLLIVLIMGTGMVMADTIGAVPVLISEPTGNMVTLRGYIETVSEDEIVLALKESDEVLEVAIGTYDLSGEYPYIKYKDFVELSVEMKDGAYTLKDVVMFSPLMYSVMPINEVEKAFDVEVAGEILDLDVQAQEIDGVIMVPVRLPLEALGYTVTWKEETGSVDLSKGAQWTSIKVGSNAYFKNRMASQALSAGPMIVDGRLLVPLEFYSEILELGFSINDGTLSFNDFPAVNHTGYVKNYKITDSGVSITLTSDYESDDMMLQTIIHTSVDFTVFQKTVKVGEEIRVVGSMMMTASIPGQTQGYVIY